MLTRAAVVLTSVLFAQAPAAPLTIRSASRALAPGELVALTITTAQPVDTLRARAFNRDLTPFKLSDNSWQVLVGIDLDVKPGTHVVTIDGEPASRAPRTTHRLVVRAKTFPTRRLTVDPSFVNPPAEVVPRIQEEARLLETLWTASAPSRFWTMPFVAPVPQPANSAFGTRSVFNGVPRSPHGGADFPSPTGTPIHAPNRGRIVLARDLYFTGQTVVIDHGLGLFSLFAHLSRIAVHEEDIVDVGQIVGDVGSTGRVTGAHLHWAVRAGSARVDPLSLLSVLGQR